MEETPYTLYLVRHAEAADRSDAYPDDDLRPLTPDGMTRFRAEVRALGELGVSIDRILSSPLVRARQTAEILSEVQPGHPPVLIADALAPGGSAARVFRDLARLTGDREVALVGHEPGIGQLAGRLIGASAGIPFKKGAVCRIDVDRLPPAGPGRLRWFLPPKAMRKIAG